MDEWFEQDEVVAAEIPKKKKGPVRRGIARWRVWRSKRRAKRYPRAFEGDTYVADLAKAAKTESPYVGMLRLGIVVAILSDLYLMADTLNIALQDELTLRGIPVFSGLLALALLVIYLLLGYLAGKRLHEARAFWKLTSLASGVFLLFAELAALAFIFFLRLYGEIQKNGGLEDGGGLFGGAGFGGSGGLSLSFGSSQSEFWFVELMKRANELGADAFIPAIAMSAIMVIGALISAFYAYLSYDPYAGEKKKLAEVYVAEDRQLYEKVFFESALLPGKGIEYERRERELDKKAVGSAFRINRIAAQLNGIVDPADAYDFCAVSQLLGKEMGNERSRRLYG